MGAVAAGEPFQPYPPLKQPSLEHPPVLSIPQSFLVRASVMRELQLQVGLSNLIHLPLLSIPERSLARGQNVGTVAAVSLSDLPLEQRSIEQRSIEQRSCSFTCFINSAEQLGLERARRQCSCPWGFPA